MKSAAINLLFIFNLVSCVQPTISENKLSTPDKTCEIDTNAEALSDPQSISDLTTLINALPKPLNLECFLKSLKRPLFLNATSSTSSVQPAFGIHDPRIFIFKGDLIISIVPSGPGSALLEFSELINDTRSVKGELAFPIENPVGYADPFTRITNGNRTTCSACHSGERVEYVVEGASVYSSVAIKPTVNTDVSIYDLKHELYLCNFQQSTTGRCKVLAALISDGDIQSMAFPVGMPTFLNSF